MFRVTRLVRNRSRSAPGLECATRSPAILVAALLAATLVAGPARSQNPLVAHYTFDDPANTYSTGGTIFDMSGNGFNGTVVNAALTHNATGGISGGSMNAVSSGTASFTTSYAASPVAADNFTLMFWVKAGAPNGFLDFGQINYSNGTSGQLRTTDGTGRQFYNRQVFTSNNATMSPGAYLVGGAPIADSTGSGTVWKQVAFMADSATGQYGVYTDGASPVFAAFPASNNPFTSSTTITGLRIGRSNQANSRTGQIDEVQLYDRSLTQAEVQLLFANPGYGGTNFRVWDPTAASNSWTAAASDWQGLGSAAAPGVTGDTASTNADVAILKNYAFSGGLGIDMSAAGANGSLALGGISFNSASGPLRIGNSAADTNGTLRLNGGLVDSVANTILKVAGSSDLTIGNSASGSGAQTMGLELTGATNLIDVAASRTLTIESAVAGFGSAIQKTGAGTLSLSGANTFTGGTTIAGGTLEVASIADSGTSNLGTFGDLALRGGTLRYTGTGAQSTTRILSIEQAPSTIDVASGSGSLTLTPAFGTLAANLSKAGPGTLALNAGLFGTGGLNVAAGTLTLAAAGSHSGSTSVASGSTLEIGHADALQASTLTPAAGANVSFTAAAGTTYSIAGLAGSGSINATGNTLSIGATNASSAFLGSLTADALTKQGGGALVLSGTNSLNSVTVAAGTLIAGSTAALGGGPVTLAGGALRLVEGATLTDNIQLTGSPFSATISVFSGIDYLVVGGGGGGGGGVSGVAYPAGGGGGQVLVGEGLQPTAATLSVTVGAGGTYGNAAAGGTGGTSSLADLTASGGGGGGAAGAGRGGASGSGNAGGLNNGTTAAGGGGGQTAAGLQGIGSPRRGGHGGAGLTSAITGTELMYGFGGGGGAPPTTDPANLSLNGDGTSTNPRANSGGGGRATSGPSTTTGIGADGIVIVRYAGAPAATGGSIDTSTVPGYTLHTFPSGSTDLVFNPIARTIAGTLSGSGGFTYDSFGTLTLSANNSYQGGTIVSRGTLVAGHSAALGSGAVTVNAGGRLRLDQGSVIANEVTDLGSGFFAGTLEFAGGGLARTSTAGNATLGTLLAGSANATELLNPAIAWQPQTAATASDIMRLTGTNSVPQVLSLTYDPANAPGVPQQGYLGWFDPTSTSWVNAIDGNFGGTSSFFEGSWTAYMSANPGATPTSALGVYGHDSATSTVWAVVNHNSDFAVIVVPEPGTLALAGLGLAATFAALRRRWRIRGAGL